MNSINELDNNIADDVDLKIIFLTLIKNKKTLIFSIIFGFILGGFYLIFKKPVYQGQFAIVVSDQKTTSRTRESLEGSLTINSLLGASKNQKLKTQLEILESPLVLMPVFEYVKELKIDNGKDISKLFFGKWRRENFASEIGRDTRVLNVAYKDTDREIIFPVIKKLSETYQDYSRRGRNKGLKNLINYLDDQKSIFREKVNNSSNLVRDFAFDNDLTPLSPLAVFELLKDFPKEDNFLIKEFSASELERVEAKKNIDRLKLAISRMNLSKGNEENVIFLKNDPLYKDLEFVKSLEELDNDINKARGIFKEDDLYVQRLTRQREMLLKKVKLKALSYFNDEIKIEETRLEKSKRSNFVLNKYSNLIRDHLRNEITLSELEDQYNEISLELARKEEPWELISEPQVRGKPISPKKSFILPIGALLGLLIGAVFVLVNYRRLGILNFYDEFKFLIGKDSLIAINGNLNVKDFKEILCTHIKNEYHDESIGFYALNQKIFNKFQKLVNEINKNIGKNNIELFKEIEFSSKFENIILLTTPEVDKNTLVEKLSLLRLSGKYKNWIFKD